MSRPDRAANAAAIRRSLDVYYRDTARTARMDRLNACFVPPGGLAFDIGAHVGDRAASFLRLGARVVALEPQPAVFRVLRLIHGRTRRAVLLPLAAGAEEGEAEMFVNTANPTVSTTSRNLVDTAPRAAEWRNEVWDGRLRVPMTTLDRLVARHGLPDFAKIDVEGHELEVLRGLGRPLRALSFEFTTLQREVAFGCLDLLDGLADYEFNVSLGEEHRLRHAAWIGAAAMREVIARLPQAANSGDVYARLRVTGT